MYKKIIITLSAIIVLSLPFQQQYAESAIFSKVASKGAQKIVKEVIKESAFDIAIDLFVNEAYDMAIEEQSKYQAQQDYELFCGKKMPDLITCEKPMQVKKVLTSADKTNIGNQAEIELDKLITNGKGFTRWQKFLDWFLPIWVASFALTAITYAIDPEVRSLFNEAGYNALVALGLIKPVTDITQIAEQEPQRTYETTPTTGTTETTEFKQNTQTDTSSPTHLNANQLVLKTETTVLETYSHTIQRRNYIKFNYGNATVDGEFLDVNFANSTIKLSVAPVGTKQLAIQKNGILVHTSESTSSLGIFTNIPAEHLNQLESKTQSIRTRLPYKIGEFYYTDVLLFTTEGDTLHYQIKMTSHTMPSDLTWATMSSYRYSPVTTTESFIVYKNKSPFKKIIVPEFAEIEQDLEIPKSKYEDDKGQIALIPPSALPYTQTTTGIQLTPEIDETTGEQKFTTPTGESIPEDDITVGEPNIQENPSPEPNTVTPPATQTNPLFTTPHKSKYHKDDSDIKNKDDE